MNEDKEFEFEEASVEKTAEEGPEEKYRYKTRKGFLTTNVLRGFTEIESLYNILMDEGLKDKAIICGGYVRYMCSPVRHPTPADDLDIYSRDTETFDKLKHIMEAKLEFKAKADNDMAITYHHTKLPEDAWDPLVPNHDLLWLGILPRVQLIRPMKKGAIVSNGNMENILENFDFTVIRCGLLSPKTALVDADFHYDESKKCLRIKNIHCPISSTFRVIKYASKGYWANPLQICRLFMDWDNRSGVYRSDLIRLIQETEIKNLTKEEIEKLEILMRID